MNVHNVKPYILFFEPVFKERIWGGDTLERLFGYSIPNQQTGEAWVISDHPHGRTVVRNGELQGQTLHQLWENQREWFGRNSFDRFPLLVKLLDAKNDLSVQVHPDDSYAALHENGEKGKTEAWLVLYAAPGAKIVYGHHAKNRDEFESLVGQGAWHKLLNEVPVQAGDFYYVPSGCLHALGAGIVVLEIQQSSDTTYRVYDYDRIDATGNKRGLHLQKAFETVSFATRYEKTEPVIEQQGDNQLLRYMRSPYFTIDRWNVRGTYAATASPDSFLLVSVIQGSGVCRWGEYLIEETPIQTGDHFLIPSNLGDFQINGELDLVVTRI